jgi:hypothetical protein
MSAPLDIDGAVVRARRRFEELRPVLMSALIIVEFSEEFELSAVALDRIAVAFDRIERALTVRSVTAIAAVIA